MQFDKVFWGSASYNKRSLCLDDDLSDYLASLGDLAFTAQLALL
jgi:hypothetical protein